MSNRLNLDATKFENPVTGNYSCGFKIYDDYSKAYYNLLDDVPFDDLQLLAEAIKAGEEGEREIQDMLDFCEENEKGLYINEQWYDWEEIKHLFEGENDSH